MTVETDPSKLALFVDLPQQVDSVRFFIRNLGANGSWTPGPTDLRLVAFISTIDSVYLTSVKERCQERMDLSDGMLLDSSEARILLGDLVMDFNSIDTDQVQIAGWTFDAGPITKSPYGSNAVGVIFNKGILVVATTT
jgi:hypothetical protein